MKEAGSPINEHIFESLIYGYSLLGEIEKADELIEIMSELNLEPNHLIYAAKMRGMIKNGHGKLLKSISRFFCLFVKNSMIFKNHKFSAEFAQ